MGKKARNILVVAAVISVMSASGCVASKDYELIPTTAETTEETVADNVMVKIDSPSNTYDLLGSIEVEGRQGVCTDGNSFWVSGSRVLAKYDKDWNLLAANWEPFKGYNIELNHIGDLDVYNNELYICAEYFSGDCGKNIKLAVFDSDTLELKRFIPFAASSGQRECSGLAVDADTKTLWLCSWIDDESSNYLYKYDIETGKYLGKVPMEDPPKWIQGMAFYGGSLYLSSDDGDADRNEPDHLYKATLKEGVEEFEVNRERAFYDVTRQGEIEGITFDHATGRMFLLHNRGERFVNGSSAGYYKGYDHEIKEVFIYWVQSL